MNIQGIKRNCTRAGRCILISDAYGYQWLSDGVTAYLVEGITLDVDSIAHIFDLDEKQLEKMTIQACDMSRDARIDHNPTGQDRNMENIGAVWCESKLYRALRGRGGMAFVEVEELKPITGKSGYLEFFERENEKGDILIAAFTDMFVSAMLTPVDDEMSRFIIAHIRRFTEQPLYMRSSTREAAAQRAADSIAEAGAHFVETGTETRQNGVITHIYNSVDGGDGE